MQAVRALVLLASVAAAPLAGQRLTERYDPVFRKYAKRYFGPAFDWRWFKAQGLTESDLDPSAISLAGARGIMQLMPSTFAAIQSRNPAFTAVDDPEWNIAAGIFHDRQLWRQWRGAVADPDHLTFMFGSYNAGRTPIVRAQELARLLALDPRLWASVCTVAPRIPRWRHRETLNYVARIAATWARLDPRGRVSGRPVQLASLPPCGS